MFRITELSQRLGNAAANHAFFVAKRDQEVCVSVLAGQFSQCFGTISSNEGVFVL